MNTNQLRSDNEFNEHDPWVLRATSGLISTARANALNLMKYIHSSGDVSWDEKGRLILNGRTYPSTNIANLVSDAVRISKTRKPAYMSEAFARGLENINTPKEYIKNKDYLNPSEAENYYSLSRTPIPVVGRSKISTKISKKKPPFQSGHGIAHWITKLL